MDRPQATPRVLRARPLSRNAFEPFGEVLDASGPYDGLANGDAAQIFRDRATLDVAELGVRARVNIVRTAPTRLPLMLEMMERHPPGQPDLRATERRRLACRRGAARVA